jgi:PAS domain S-box-containing protein
VANPPTFRLCLSLGRKPAFGTNDAAKHYRLRARNIMTMRAKRTLDEQGLYESERIFRLLVNGVIDYAIYMISPQGIVTSWNAGAERIKGYSADEIVGQHFSKFYTREDFDAGLPALALQTALKAGTFSATGWRIRKDGSKFLASIVIDPIYEDSKLIGFAKITRDITEQNEAAAALASSESRFRLLVNNVTDYALYMLSPDGIVSNWNIGGERIKGYTADEIVGQHFSRFYTEVDRAAGRPARALEIARTAGRYEEDGWRVRKDGTFFWASVVIDPVRNDAGELVGFAKITRDITERREAQLRLQQVERQLAESRKMDALGQLTGGVAHDFNNLLMIISGSAHALRKAAAGDPRAIRALQAIEGAAQRGGALTKQLLSFARRQHLNPQAINVAHSVAMLSDVLDSGTGSAVHLVIEVDPQTWPIVADPAEFEVALVNLVLNARDAMPKGGTVTVTAKNLHADGSSGQVEIVVSDVGEGIPPDVISKVFDPFFTTKPTGKGTGLGLSQVYGFVHQAGGTIRIESELGSGTSVIITLPRADTSIQGASERSSIGSGTVLLVEDNPDVAMASTTLLEQLGYSVRWVPNASAALHEVAKDDIDLVFSDIVMPGEMDGLALARMIHQQRPDLPILLTTGYSEAAHAATAKFPIIRKPYELQELSRTLTSLRSR